MKIQSIEAIPLKVPYWDLALPRNSNREFHGAHYLVLLKVQTDDGLVGYGETFSLYPLVQRALVALIEDAMAPVVVGSDAHDISAVSQKIQERFAAFGRGGLIANAMGALEIALWDIAGRRGGLPVHQLLGGAVKTEIPCIAALSSYLDSAIVADCAREAINQGYRRVKIHERDIDVIRAARTAIGPDIPLIVDVNCHWSVEYARQVLPALMECNPHFLEDPIWPPENFDALRQLKNQFDVPLATGADASTVWRFKEILDADVISYAQPDVCTVGGILEFSKVAALCAMKGVTVSPHTPFYGPAMLATLHLLATISDDAGYSCLFVDYGFSICGAAGTPNRGVLQVPQGPGLGFEPNPDFLEKYRVALT